MVSLNGRRLAKTDIDFLTAKRKRPPEGAMAAAKINISFNLIVWFF